MMRCPVPVLLLFLLHGCHPARESSTAVHEGTLAVAWTQTSGERIAATLQAFQLARERVEQALAQPDWSADVEQITAGGYRELPPAVILDVDETVLDNSPYQVRLIQSNRGHDPDLWTAWVREEAATPLWGAREFTNRAAGQGVRVFYITNRDSAVEEPTRRNLIAAGFPVEEGVDVVLTRGEVEEGSDKSPRRARVAEGHRILLLVGDDLNDFVSGTRADRATREKVVLQYGDLWGRKWILIPNPMYGGWERGLAGEAFGPEALRRIVDQLDPRQEAQ